MASLTNTLMSPCFDHLQQYSPCYDESEDEGGSASLQSLRLYQRILRSEENEKPAKRDLEDLAKLLLAWVQDPTVDGSELSPSSPETWSLLSLRRLSEVEGFVGLVKSWNESLQEEGDLKEIAKRKKLKPLTAEQCCFLDFLVVTVNKLRMISGWLHDYKLESRFLDSRLTRLETCLEEFGNCKAFLKLYQSGLNQMHPGTVLFHDIDTANRRLNPEFERALHERLVYPSPYSSCARFYRDARTKKPYFSQVLGGPNGGRRLRLQGARVLTYYSPIKIDIRGLLPAQMKSVTGDRDLSEHEVKLRKDELQDRFLRLFASSLYKEAPKIQALDPASAKANIAKSFLFGHQHILRQGVSIQDPQYPQPDQEGQPSRVLCSVEPAVEMLKALQSIDKELTESGSAGVQHPFEVREDITYLSPARLIKLGIRKGWLKPYEYPKNYRTVIQVPSAPWE